MAEEKRKKIRTYIDEQIQSIPVALADLSDDSTHRLVTDTEKSTWDGKQEALVSGTNIKTINGSSILGSNDLEISEQRGVAVFVSAIEPTDQQTNDIWIKI